MALKFKKFRNIEEANLLLNGAIVGGQVSTGVDNLVGKTITFTSPAKAITFTQGTQYQGRLSFAEIKAQCEAAASTMRVLSIDGRIVFRHTTPGTAISLAAADEPARVLLGLPNNEAISGTVYAGPDGVAPKVVQFQPQNDTVYTLLEEV